MKKRFFAFALALCLCLTLLPAAALAREPDENTEWKNADPVDVTSAAELKAALPEGEPEPDDDNIIWLPVARLAADVTLDGETSVRSVGTLIVPEGMTLTVGEGATCEAGVENHGTVIVLGGGALQTTMGGSIQNDGTLRVERYGTLMSQMGASVVNGAGATLQLDGLFYCNGYLDTPWFRSEGTVSGSGQAVMRPLFGETKLADRLSAYAALCTGLGDSEITPYIAATDTAELAALSAENVAGIFVTASEEAREKDDFKFHLTESVDLGSKNLIVEAVDLELDPGATLTVLSRDHLAYVGRFAKIVVKAECGTLCFADVAVIGGCAAANAIFTVTEGQMFTGGAEWAMFGSRYPTDQSTEWYYVRYDGTVDAKGTLTEALALPVMVDGVLNVTGDFTAPSMEVRNVISENGGKAYIRDLLYCWDSAECAVRGTEHTEFDLAFDLNCGNGYADVFDHLGYDQETGRFYLDAEPELVAPKREGYVFVGWEVVTEWDVTEAQLAEIWIQTDKDGRAFLPWPTEFPYLMRARWAETATLGDGAIPEARTVVAQDGEVMAHAAIYCRDAGCVAFAARYDEAGRFLGIEMIELTPGEINGFTLSRGDAERVCFFALSGNSAPLCEAGEA